VFLKHNVSNKITNYNCLRMKVQFYLRFQTEFGDSLLISGNTDELGNDDLSKALPMTYFNEEFWE